MDDSIPLLSSPTLASPTLSTSSVHSSTSAKPEKSIITLSQTEEVFSSRVDNNANNHLFFSNPEIRAFLFGKSEMLLGSDLPSFTVSDTRDSVMSQSDSSDNNTEITSSTKHHHKVLASYSSQFSADLDSTITAAATDSNSIDSPLVMSPDVAADEYHVISRRAPIASYEEDDDLSGVVSLGMRTIMHGLSAAQILLIMILKAQEFNAWRIVWNGIAVFAAGYLSLSLSLA